MVLCECLNSVKAKLAVKGISWNSSWAAQVCVAILNFKEGHNWKLDTYSRLALEWGWQPLPARCHEHQRSTSLSRLPGWLMQGGRTLGSSRRSGASLAKRRVREAEGGRAERRTAALQRG
jgi:hypothetical protein